MWTPNYKWLSHIGIYAMRDIELSYDYNYGIHGLLSEDHGGGVEKQQQKKIWKMKRKRTLKHTSSAAVVLAVIVTNGFDNLNVGVPCQLRR